ncbi:hypothetical protein FRUB_00745 [Fimbriiglobus ruber]|uniref:Uncharacterized protein n=2 Tax=Fimbriiglobus ruber TaxID=1908690 RepID=A0A225EAI9_9BACT|nr:hypothetical protein FRUB_00745 [Fimbriiglobus ruber]
MRNRLYGGLLLVGVAVFVGASPAGAQDTYQYAGNPEINLPYPTGNPSEHGFFTTLEFMYLTQTRAIGDQTVAYRGLIDSTGNITGIPGTYIGSRLGAVTTGDFPRGGFQPGFKLDFGYKLDDGTSIYVNYMRQFEVNSHAGASLVPPFFRSDTSLADTFLVSGVYNFPAQFAGPLNKTQYDAAQIAASPTGAGGGNTYGIWNGASQMDIQFNQWFTQAEFGMRVPMFQNEYSRVYGMGGARFDWFYDRFKWLTVDYDINGNQSPSYAATYTNTLSQRMYGPFVGCGNEVFLGNRASLSLDLTGALLMDIIKERAKYELNDETIQNKLSRDEFNIVPSVTANVNLWWYPIEGVQIRAGYSCYTFFNTKYMSSPVGFDYATIDPVYSTQFIRIVHGANFGLMLFF